MAMLSQTRQPVSGHRNRQSPGHGLAGLASRVRRWRAEAGGVPHQAITKFSCLVLPVHAHICPEADGFGLIKALLLVRMPFFFFPLGRLRVARPWAKRVYTWNKEVGF